METNAYSDWWQSTWDERYRALRSHLDPMVTPDEVTSFSWDDHRERTPGGSALVFMPTAQAPRLSIITMGLTQPLDCGAPANKWEFALHVERSENWCYRLLHDLMGGIRLYGELRAGHFLPVSFFNNGTHRLDCVTAVLPEGRLPSSTTGIYLWPSLLNRTLFEVSTGSFFLMAVTLVHRDEEEIADATSPPHLLLVLKECGYLQPCDPFRPSVLLHNRFSAAYERVRELSHRDAVAQLQSRQ